jgi:hypothetical protein
MSIFKYTLPSGSKFTMTAPTGTTQAQADAIFYGQVAAGTFVGYSAGQTLTSTASSTAKFVLSRLDRGIAGVDERAVLAVVNNIPNISGLPHLTNVPLTNAISQADLVMVNSGAQAIGPLNESQVQGLMAQVTNLVSQPANVATNDRGAGQYGLFCQQLEQAGYVKPGTYQRFIFGHMNLVDVLNVASVWTGLNGIYSLDDFLNSTDSQNSAQQTLMQNSYQGLLSAGVITPTPEPAVTAVQGQVYTESGLQSVSTLSVATGASLSVTPAIATALAGTALASLLSSPITNLATIGSGAIGLSSIATGLYNTANTAVSGAVGALINNGATFGTAATAAWASLGNISVDSIGNTLSNGLTSLENFASKGLDNIEGSIKNLASGAENFITNGYSGISTALNNLPGSLSGLANGLDITGKASSFATAFSNPLGSLSNLGGFNIGGLGLNNIGGLTASLGNLGNLGSLTNLSSLGNLGELTTITNLTGSLGSLGSLSSLGSLGSLGSLSSLGSLGSLGSLASLGDLGSLGSIGGLFGGGGDELVSGTQVAAGFSNTVNRATVDSALKRILGSNKIPVPKYEYPSASSAGPANDVAQGQSIFAGLSSSSSQGFGSTLLG